LSCFKIGNTGLEVVDSFQINTLKFGNIYSLRAISKEKTDLLTVGGNKSVATFAFRENKFSLMQEFINIHSGPVIDTIYSKFFVSTAAHKDHFIQMIGVEQYGDKNFSTSLKNRLEFLIPKLKADYDCWSVKSYPLPNSNFTTLEISADLSTAILGSSKTPGLVKMSIGNPASTSTVLPQKKVNSIFSTGKNFLISTEDERALYLLLPDLSEINSIPGSPLKPESKDIICNLKHYNSEDVVLWMKETLTVIQVTSDSLSVQTLPPLEIAESHVLVSCAASNSLAVTAMYLRNPATSNEDVLVTIKNFEVVQMCKTSSILPNGK
jgi:hypothetical protein